MELSVCYFLTALIYTRSIIDELLFVNLRLIWTTTKTQRFHIKLSGFVKRFSGQMV